MVRQLIPSDLKDVRQHSIVIDNYAIEEINFSKSMIQINDETGELEWFYILSNRELPEYFDEECYEEYKNDELIDLWYSNDDNLKSLKLNLRNELMRLERGYIMWIHNDERITEDKLPLLEDLSFENDEYTDDEISYLRETFIPEYAEKFISEIGKYLRVYSSTVRYDYQKELSSLSK